MNDTKFNNLTLSDEEVERIIRMFENEINRSSTILGRVNEDCKQEIIINIYKTLTQNRGK